MKHVFKFIYLFVLAVALQNCSEDESVNLSKEKVQFTFDLNTADASNGKVHASSLPVGAKVLVSIESGSGSSVFTFQQLEILRVGTSLLTLPLELTPGSYKLTDFLIVNEHDEILFGTPKSGSALASLVAKPLALNFSVSRNQVNNIQMEVVDVSQNAPEDFGYVSFYINIVNPMQIAVFKPKGNALQLTSAKAYILKDSDTLQHFNLGARVNLVGFRQSKDETYTLMIVKNGYALYKEEFIYDDLIAELNGQPLKVILTPALTLLPYVGETNIFSFVVDGTVGTNVTVDWGDGASNSYTFGSGEMMEHIYPAPGNYFVSVVGDLNAITYFYSFYGNGMVDEINLEHLKELKEIRLGLTRSPRVVDLSHNTKLEFVLMPNAANTEIIDFPTDNNINYVSVSGPNALTSASLSAMIDDVHYAAVADNRMEGRFDFTESWYEPYGGMVVVPTPGALAKLVELRDVYGWTISPNP